MRMWAASCAVVLVAAACGSSSGGGTHAQRPSSSPLPITSAVLGSADFFPRHNDAGFGSAHPSLIYNGGDGVGRVVQVRWSDWGQEVAYGIGKSYSIRPEGGYYHGTVIVKLRATGLGACAGATGYQWLWEKRQRRPHGEKWYPWSRWWGKQSLCERGGGSKSP
jgi:hypothetical protein